MLENQISDICIQHSNALSLSQSKTPWWPRLWIRFTCYMPFPHHWDQQCQKCYVSRWKEREMWQILSLITKLKRYFSLVTNTEKTKNAEFLIVIRPQTLGLSTVMLFHYDFLTSPSPLPYPSWAPPPPPPLKYHILHTFINTSPKLLTKRICLTIRSFLSWWSFPIFLRS